jgi:hypothetical protein
MQQRYAGFVVGFPVAPDGRIVVIKNGEQIGFLTAEHEATGCEETNLLQVALRKIGLATDRQTYEHLSYIPPSTEEKWTSKGLEWIAYKISIKEQDLLWLKPESEYGQIALLSPEIILAGELHSWYRHIIAKRL